MRIHMRTYTYAHVCMYTHAYTCTHTNTNIWTQPNVAAYGSTPHPDVVALRVSKQEPGLLSISKKICLFCKRAM